MQFTVSPLPAFTLVQRGVPHLYTHSAAHLPAATAGDQCQCHGNVLKDTVLLIKV